MAFQALVNGSADCGPSNPLQNLLKHSERDSQSSRFDGATQMNPTTNFRNLSHQGSSSNRPDMDSLIGPQGLHDMSSIRNELDLINLKQSRTPGPSNPRASEWSSQFSSHSNLPVSPEEFARMEHSFRVSSEANLTQTIPPGLPSQWTQQFSLNDRFSETPQSEISKVAARHQNFGLSSRMMPAPPMDMFPFEGSFLGNCTRLSSTSQRYKESGSLQNEKLVELDDKNWEAEFAKFGAEIQAAANAQTSAAVPEQSSSQANSKSADSAAETQQEDSEADVEFARSLEATWKNLASDLDLSNFMESEMSKLGNEFGEDSASPQLSEPVVTMDNVDDFIKDPTPYPFQVQNPYIDHPDPFQEGQRLIISGEPLCEAALAFEAACILDEKRGEAWRMLGETHAADEREHLAVQAFEKAVTCGGTDGQASWISLAICWVNEGRDTTALAILERWLRDTYPEIGSKAPSHEAQDHRNPWSRHNAIVDKFIAAARAGPGARQGVGKETVQGQAVDADVQVGLGVLFYSNTDYELAKDCFEAALQVNPSDFLLWNRLGATLSNGGQSEEAIDAYRKALELRPTFTRAIYNMGVSCLNIHCYKEAAEHLLAALSLQQKSAASKNQRQTTPTFDGSDGSENLWYTLRRVFLSMEREDLADRAKPDSDVESFKADGFEF